MPKTPHTPAEVVAQGVAASAEEPANRHVLDGVGDVARVGDRGELEVEVVERALVLVAGLAGKPVGDRVVRGALLALHVLADVVVHVVGERGPESRADEDLRVAAREDRVEPVAEDEPVEAGGRREDRGAQLAPEARPLPAAFQQQARHPERGLADEGAADRGVDVVIEGGRRGLPGRLPKQAAAQAVGQRPLWHRLLGLLGRPASVASAPGAPAAFRVRVWAITSRGRGPTEGASAAGGG